jgi:hypothetical protein
VRAATPACPGRCGQHAPDRVELDLGAGKLPLQADGAGVGSTVGECHCVPQVRGEHPGKLGPVGGGLALNLAIEHVEDFRG